MKKHLIAICALLLAGSSLLHAEQVYDCAAEAAVGIDKRGGKWMGGSFKKSRHTLKFNEDYTVLETGGNKYMCSKVYLGKLSKYQHSVICYSASSARGELINYHDGVFFMFNKKILRFLHVSAQPSGYLMETGDTNTIEGGTCEKF